MAQDGIEMMNDLVLKSSLETVIQEQLRDAINTMGHDLGPLIKRRNSPIKKVWIEIVVPILRDSFDLCLTEIDDEKLERFLEGKE
ncbi:hypothetical protein D4R87_03425 [bacterium]|nr:MAG: hypothetical protein D4R87_03425 [bacterium]